MGKSNFGKMGNVKMKGKTHLRLSCQCCTCIDLREAKERRRIERELLETDYTPALEALAR